MQPQIVIIPAMRKVNYDPADDIPPISALATNLLPINGKLPATTVAKFVAWVARSPASRARRGAGSLVWMWSLVGRGLATRCNAERQRAL